MTPTVTLTTDFGTGDAYVAEMKGVLLCQRPAGLRLVDLSHELPPHDVGEAAFFLRAAVPRFPEGTVHLVVVDPGVGSARAPLIAQVGGQVLVGPDNGVFGYLFDGSERVFAIEPARLGRRAMSASFHGRDLFAPAAARLAAGAAAEELGNPFAAYQRLSFPLAKVDGSVLRGEVVHVDRFGNLITNLTEDLLNGFLPPAERRRALIAVRGTQITALSEYYAQAPKGTALALVGSGGLLEIAVCEGSAAARLGAGVGEPVSLRRAESNT